MKLTAAQKKILQNMSFLPASDPETYVGKNASAKKLADMGLLRIDGRGYAKLTAKGSRAEEEHSRASRPASWREYEARAKGKGR